MADTGAWVILGTRNPLLGPRIFTAKLADAPGAVRKHGSRGLADRAEPVLGYRPKALLAAFDAGAHRAEVQRTKSVFVELSERYRATVLSAF